MDPAVAAAADLVAAAARNDAPAVTRLLLAHAGLAQAPAPDGVPALWAALESRSSQAALALVSAGADPDLQPEWAQASPLSMAHACGAVRALVSAGADVRGDPAVETPLYVACAQALPDSVSVLVDAGAPVSARTGRCARGEPLVAACACGDVAVVRRLVRAGCAVDPDVTAGACAESISSRDSAARAAMAASALVAAAERSHVDVVHQLLVAGAFVDARAGNSQTALYAASRAGSESTVALLLTAGADVNAACTDAGETALYAASSCGHAAIVNLLLGARADVEARGYYGTGPTAIYAACEAGHADVVKLLLGAGASLRTANESPESLRGVMLAGSDVFGLDGVDFTPLVIACRNGYEAVVAELLHVGSAGEISPADSAAAFVFAAVGGHMRICEMLADVGTVCPPVFKANVKEAIGKAALKALRKRAEKYRLARATTGAIGGEGAPTFNSGSNRTANIVRFGTLHLACIVGNTDVIGSLLRYGEDLEAESNDKYTGTLPLLFPLPLILACHYGHVDAVEILLSSGASPEHCMRTTGDTPLHVAARTGNAAVAKLLLKWHTQHSPTNKLGQTPLQVACERGHAAVADCLVRSGASVDYVNVFGDTSLHLASRRGHAEVVSVIAECSSAVDARNVAGATPLFLAVQGGHVDAVNLLVAAGAAVDQCVESDGNCALHVACHLGSAEIISRLLCGPDSNIYVKTRNKSGATGLYIAAEMGHLEAVHRLIEAGADVEEAAGNSLSPLIAATRAGHVAVAEALLRAGAPADYGDKHGDTALHYASRLNLKGAALLLLEHGASVDAENAFGATPLYGAAACGNVELVDVLVAHGAQVDREAACGGGATPLVYACMREGNAEAIAALVRHGAAVDRPRRSDGYTALHVASRVDHRNVAQLVECRADVNAVAADGYTPLVVAGVNEDRESCALLVSAGARVPQQLVALMRECLGETFWASLNAKVLSSKPSSLGSPPAPPPPSRMPLPPPEALPLPLPLPAEPPLGPGPRKPLPRPPVKAASGSPPPAQPPQMPGNPTLALGACCPSKQLPVVPGSRGSGGIKECRLCDATQVNSRLGRLGELSKLFGTDCEAPTLLQAALDAEVPDAENVVAECTKLGESVAATLAGELTAQDAAAIALYCHEMADAARTPCRAINVALNDRNLQRLRGVRGLLLLFLRALRRLPRVRRGALHRCSVVRDVAAAYAVGSVVVWNTFCSTTEDGDAAEALLGGRPGVLFRIHGASGYNIKPFSSIHTADEIVLEPGAEFTVKEVSVKGNHHVVDLEYIPREQMFLEKIVPALGPAAT
eukprot:m51a1_g1711 hypothetical protein (1300) ;mRNA; f:530732-535140